MKSSKIHVFSRSARDFSSFVRASSPYKPHIRLGSYSGIIYRLTN
ncbi:hypothetical protein QM450_01810 [Streptococcus infantis]